MNRTAGLILVFVALAGVAGARGAEPPAAAGTNVTTTGTTLRMVEGTIDELSVARAEAGLEVVAARLRTADGPRIVLLAPSTVLAQVGFEVRPGDELRGRVFVDGVDGPFVAHKVMNVTRGTMVRLRTLSRVPLWDSAGKWEGGPGAGGRGPATGPGFRNRGGSRGGGR